MSVNTRNDAIINFLLPIRRVGQATAEAIVDAFGTDLDALRNASDADLLEVDGIGVTTARALRKRLRVLETHGLHIPVEALEHDEKRKNILTCERRTRVVSPLPARDCVCETRASWLLLRRSGGSSHIA